MALCDRVNPRWKGTSRDTTPLVSLWARWPRWFLIGLGLLLALGNTLWVKRHVLMMPPSWDQAFYLFMSLRYLHALADGGLLALLRAFVYLSPDVAPLFPLMTLPLYLLFGPSRLVAHLANTCFLFLLLVGVYLLGVYLYGRLAAVLAVFCLVTFNAVVNFSRDYLFEFPASAVLTLSLYALLRSEGFRLRSWCLLFGGLAGATILTKTMDGVFFVGPVIYAVGALIWRRQLNRRRLINGALAAAMGILVASIWWGPNFRRAFGYLIYYGFQEGSVPYSTGGSELFTLNNLSAYALSLINYGTSFSYALLFIVVVAINGLTKIVRRGRRMAVEGHGYSQDGYLWMWILVGYAVLTVVPNKGGERYALPLLPPLALLLAGAIERLRPPWLRYTTVAAAVALGAFNYLGLTYTVPGLPQVVYFHPFALVSHEFPHYRWLQSLVQLSPETRWPIADLLLTLSSRDSRDKNERVTALLSEVLDQASDVSIDEDVRMLYRLLLRREPNMRELKRYVQARQKNRLTRQAFIDILIHSSEFKNTRVLVVPDHPVFNPNTLRYYAELSHSPLNFSRILDGPVDRHRLQEFRFALVKEGGFQGPAFSTRYNDRITMLLREPTSGFIPLPHRYAFPDGSEITVYAATSGEE